MLVFLPSLRELTEKLYPGSARGQPSPVDGTVAFYRIIQDRIPADSTLLDFGAGRGASFSDDRSSILRELVRLKPKVVRRIGVDVDPIAQQNPALDEAYLLNATNGYRIPVPDKSIEVVLADWVLEHLADPVKSLKECHRVLKPGGLFAARTPNKWHYSYVVSRAVGSGWLGRALLRISQPQRRREDVYPTHYRANTPRHAKALLRAAGFSNVETHTHEPEPAYMMFSRATLLLGWVYGCVARRGLLPRASLFIFATA